MNLSTEDIHEILLAGAFESYIDKGSAQTIGLVPKVSLDNIKSVGNTAGTGAMLSLLSTDVRQDARKIAEKAECIELSSRPDFQQEFIDAMLF